jgi:endonuclease YncB( thermonuclease family)
MDAQLLRRSARLAAVAIALALGARDAGGQEPVRVIDGDTIQVGAERIRIVGIDSPEMRARCEAEAILARVAQARMQELVIDGVSLERRGRDRYRRTRAVIRNPLGQDLGQVMVAEGLARPASRRGPRYDWCR